MYKVILLLNRRALSVIEGRISGYTVGLTEAPIDTVTMTVERIGDNPRDMVFVH